MLHDAAGSDAQLTAELMRLRRLMSLGSVGTWDLDLITDRVTWSRAHYRLFGVTESVHPLTSAIFFGCIHPDDRARVQATLEQARMAQAEFCAEFRVVRQDDGTTIWAESHGTFFYEAGEAVRGAGICLDITRRKTLEAALETDQAARRSLEAKLFEAQKMEAIGQLAGGVAHDFNNLLTVIMGNVEFARRLGPEADARHPELDEIEQATTRAQTLVAQLLAFSRKQVVQIRTLDLRAVLLRAEPMLRRILGPDVSLALATTTTPEPVAADDRQLEAVLVNLLLNARDAVLTAAHGYSGRGGTITVTLRRVTHTLAEAPHWPMLAHGAFAELVVQDTGHGMTAEVRDRIFEPFFTTKPIGTGTGLGLSQVMGIVEQCGGAIRVDSHPGEGTTVALRFPLQAAVSPTLTPTSSGSHRAVQSTVLLVEDEPAVRRALTRMLEVLGQRVLSAADVQIHGHPVIFSLTGERRLRVRRVNKTQVIPA